jgi:HEAT repeat protein
MRTCVALITTSFCCLALAACGPIANVRPGAQSVLEVFQPPSPEEAVRMATDEYDANRRFQGLNLLAGASFASEPVYVKLFQDRLADNDHGIRAIAARALGAHGSPDIAPSLAAMLVSDPEPRVRAECARALQRVHNPVVIDALFTAMDPAKEFEPAVRSQAAQALGQYRESRVVERLITAMADESLPVNLAALDSLRTLTGNDFGTSRQAWQAWYGKTETATAANAGYTYPAYARGKRWFEYIPFVPPPPTDPAGVPAGLSPAGR